VHANFGDILQIDSKIQLHYKQREVSIQAHTDHSMVATDLGHEEAISIYPSSVSDESQGCHHEILGVQVHLPPASQKDSGSDQF